MCGVVLRVAHALTPSPLPVSLMFFVRYKTINIMSFVCFQHSLKNLSALNLLVRTYEPQGAAAGGRGLKEGAFFKLKI